MPGNIVLKAQGLKTSPNQLSLPEGSLNTAENVVIRRNDVIEPTRGFKVYGNDIGDTSDRAKQLLVYKDRIFRHYSTKMEFDSGIDFENVRQFSEFDDSVAFSEVETGLRIKGIEANGNFYATSSAGIKKISATDADEFSTDVGYITKAGGLKALDLNGYLNLSYGNISGFLPQDSKVAYRILWNNKDINNYLVRGTPSERFEITNSLLSLMLFDFNKVLSALYQVSLQTGSVVNDSTYISSLLLDVDSSASELRTNLIALAEKLDQEQGSLLTFAQMDPGGAAISAGICTITTDASTANFGKFSIGDKIYLSGFTPSTTGTLNGVQTVSAVTATTVAFSTSATGTVALASTAYVQSGWFRSFTTPSAPSIPATNTELVAIQTYFQEILTELQSSRNVKTVFDNDGTVGSPDVSTPLEISTAAISAATTLTVTRDTSGSPLDFLAVGDFVYLSGAFATRVVQDLTYTEVVYGKTISIAYTNTAVAGSEVVTVTGSDTATVAISVAIQSGVSTATQVKAAIDASASARLLVSVAITGTAGTAQVTAAASQFRSGDWSGFTTDFRELSGVQTVATVTATVFTATIASSATGTITQGTGALVSRILRFPTQVQTAYLSNIDLTSTATVFLNFSTPPDATVNDFFQVYRSSLSQATGTTVLSDLTADDEMQLVYEDYPTTAQLAAGLITIEDVTLDVFRGAYLYTNSISGDGLLQANDIPPLSKDIAIWHNYVFYANTQTRHRLDLSLLGVSFLIDEATAGRTPKLVVATVDDTNVYSFVLGVREVTTVATVAASSLTSSGTSSYFYLYNAKDEVAYYVWFQLGTSTDPAIAGKTGIMVVVGNGDSNSTVATKLCNTLKTYINDFTVSVNSNTVTVTNVNVGLTTNATAQTSGATVTVTVAGVGEDASNKKILLSQDASAGQAVEVTARSLIRVVNRNTSEVVSGFYLSGTADVPGKMLLEGRGLDTPQFYIIADTVETGTEQVGDSFSPIITPTNKITAISLANPTSVTCATHGLLTNDQILIVNSNSTPSVDGIYTVTRTGANTFTIPVNVSIAGTYASFTKLTDSQNITRSDNELSPNRVYYSKVSEPEAVPILNYIDLGPKDKAILRLAPLRDGLLVFKEDGLYRLSGESAPFVNEVSDSSVIMLAPDSLAIMNNLAFAWTVQGIAMISASSSSIISRDIDPLVLPKASYANFKTITWGVGYESDNTYRVYTVDVNGDTVAKVGLQYNMISGTWTTLTNSATCGVVNSADDKLYLGAGDINSTEQERKDFNRTDYAGREYPLTMGASSYLLEGLALNFSDASNVEVGDVLVQEQYLTIYEYNQLLKKLDLDPGLTPGYEAALTIEAGDNVRTAIEALATTLDIAPLSLSDYSTSIETKTKTINAISVATSSIITTSASHELVTGRAVTVSGSNSTPSIDGVWPVTVLSPTTFSIDKAVTIAGTSASLITLNSDFRDVSTCYNIIIRKLNVDGVVTFTNYDENVNTTVQECIVEGINYNTNVATVNIALPFVQGPFTVYKATQRVITYSPLVFGDPLSWKHLRQATMMFENKNFTSASISFATDLLPEFVSTAITGLGNGIFGHGGFGLNFFGGLANSTPSRIFIPRNCARCRFLVVKFEHSVAREGFAIFGLTIVGNTSVSDRAYKV